MRTVSLQDVQIMLALQANSLTIAKRESRFGDYFYALEDDKGIIEAFASRSEAQNAIDRVSSRLPLPSVQVQS